MRTILHSDLNNFYASVECLIHPEVKEKCVVVGGAEEARHGIVLAKNMNAKAKGIKTGMVLWEARKLCPDLVVFTPHHNLYAQYSKAVKDIYREYTDQVESFGIDEAWLDVTESKMLFGNGEMIANQIRERVKKEVGLTVSVGVSFNKFFAKIGSDLKKPDAVTLITPENFKDVVWPLEVKDMLGVGHSTAEKLDLFKIKTIGQLANVSENWMMQMFGKKGAELLMAAKGIDFSPVIKDEDATIKSIGNSMTYYHDISDKREINALLCLLSESVAARLREQNLGFATVLHLYVKFDDFTSFSKQKSICPSDCAKDFKQIAMTLFESSVHEKRKVRSLGISISGFSAFKQLFLDSFEPKPKQTKVEETIEEIRDKFGRKFIKRAIALTDSKLAEIDIKGEHFKPF